MARKRQKALRLPAGEIELLNILWQTAGATITDVQDRIGREIGYTTLQTRLNRMVAKGVVRRSADRPALYSSAVSREKVSTQDLRFLVDQVTDGQVAPLVAHLVQDRTLPQSEIDELKRLIDEASARTARETCKTKRAQP